MPRLTGVRILLGLVLVVAIGLAIAWLARRPIADAAIRNAIESRGVQASYTVKDIGLRWERIENLRIGDPKAPDLTAEWAEIRVSAGLNGISLEAVRAGGVRLRGHIINGRLNLGEIDKLLPKSDGKAPFALPDLEVDVADARLLIESEWGPVASRIDGKGNLANGFVGKVAAISPALLVSGCNGAQITAYVDITVRNREPMLKGPVRAASIKCDGFAVAKADFGLDIRLNAALDRWEGQSAVQAEGAQNAQATLAKISGQVSFAGNALDTRGTATLLASAGRVGATRLSALAINGTFATAGDLSGKGQIKIARLMPDTRLTGGLDTAARTATGTPVGPMLLQVARAARDAASGIAVVADGSFAGGGVSISDFSATSASGASLRATGGNGIRIGSAGFVAETTLQLSGGGFPAVQSTLQRRPDGMTLGLAQVAPFAGGGTRVALDRIRFAANPSGAMRFETAATLDGPLSGGRVEGLRLPVNATVATNGALVINNGCTPVAFRSLSISGLALSSTTVRLCPTDGGSLVQSGNGRLAGGATINTPRLMGRLGGTPIDLTARKARVTLGTNGFVVDNFSARLGTGDRVSTLGIASLDGRFLNGAIKGRFAGTAGHIANVPLLMSQSGGEWSFRGGALALRAALTVSDELVPGRFNPLMSDNAELRLVDGQVAATATLRAPDSKTDVTKVVIAHSLSAGTGTAVLTVGNLQFGKELQPETLTRLTLGVVANVSGAISGQGDIRWTPTDVSSTGRFATEGLDFAAAFGPVAGLKGEIVFSDLLALATPPGQQITIASINPGTLVTDGVIRYQLLPDQQMTIEGGAWPFAGGDLLLDPTTLDLGQEVERKLTFRVVGLDAAKFVQQLEFENLAATGTFDGIMPMYFDANGGRIEGGRLVVRQGGGTLAYVGEISNTAMNVYAKLAFDALKSIRYKNLTIALNGPLDGEIVSQINFNGINEAPLSPPKSFIARQFIGLPFVFNIKVTAPFRSLLNTARTFQDPSLLLQRTIPELRKPPVQPAESETRP